MGYLPESKRGRFENYSFADGHVAPVKQVFVCMWTYLVTFYKSVFLPLCESSGYVLFVGAGGRQVERGGCVQNTRNLYYFQGIIAIGAS